MEWIKMVFSQIGEAVSKMFRLDNAGKQPNSAYSSLPLEPRSGARFLLQKLRAAFFFKTLWIWALALIAGIFLFRLLTGTPVVPKSTTLVFAQWWEEGLETGILEKLSAEYEAANPGVTVILEKKNWDAIRKSLERGEGPDIFSLDPFAVYELESASLLAEITEDDERDDNVLPIVSFINPLFYNIELLRNAGFDRPPKNQTEFLSYALRVKETSGIYGAGISLGDDPHSISRHILSWIWASVSNVESDNAFSFNSKEVIGALQFLNQLKSNLYPNPFSLTEGELLKAFGEGRVGMMIGSTADIKKLKSTSIGFGITTIPGSESYAKKPVFLLSVWCLGISRQSVFREEAQQFAAFLAGKSEDISAAAYAIPGNGRRSRELFQNDPYYAKAFDMYEAGEMIREIYVSSDIAGLNGIIRKEVELMFRDVKTPEQCAEAIQAEWEKLLPERKRLVLPD
jgi:multiple sugar transport system substrate-binding protein